MKAIILPFLTHPQSITRRSSPHLGLFPITSFSALPLVWKIRPLYNCLVLSSSTPESKLSVSVVSVYSLSPLVCPPKNQTCVHLWLRKKHAHPHMSMFPSIDPSPTHTWRPSWSSTSFHCSWLKLTEISTFPDFLSHHIQGLFLSKLRVAEVVLQSY